jgi:hypothetical protein
MWGISELRYNDYLTDLGEHKLRYLFITIIGQVFEKKYLKNYKESVIRLFFPRGSKKYGRWKKL